MNTRIIMRIEVEPESKIRLDEFCDRTGMTKVAAVSRLIDWFAKQPDTVQAIVQGLFPSLIEVDVASLILKRLASKKREQPAQT
jgi:hypothetical protein